ncbi:hypothetical protein [Pseudomonas sp. ENNP23]|uniref:hypothetical protein n=1 Tax=Pseudomonas sp. ENNP23 TaxID=1535636 RepID=UPI00084AAF44|nr:hypothetical protein [Pseudomonas sp. ENNP23]OEC52277.1 hypothetical protein A9G05_22235 [Pseudomonas sp. ENNP23]
MTQYKRPDETVFASGAKTGEVENFPDIARGWGVSFDQTNGIPPMEWFNALFKRNDEALRYLLQRGIAEWSATEDYPAGAHVQEGGKVWKAKATSLGKRPSSSPSEWGETALTLEAVKALIQEQVLSVGSGLPLFHVSWSPSRQLVYPGQPFADGGIFNRASFPDAWAAIAAGKVPVVDDAVWLSDPAKRCCYSRGDGSTTFRVPDYNGRFPGSIAAMFLRGDGAMSAGTPGEVQRDQVQAHRHATVLGSATANLSLNPRFPVEGAISNGIAGGTSLQNHYAVLSDTPSVEGGARTGSETRPINVTGSWTIKLFGQVDNSGNADMAKLVTEYANLASRVSIIEAKLAARGTLIVADEKVAGTQGGAAVAGVNIRTLNTMRYNTIPGAGLVGNQIVLPPGKYWYRIETTHGNVDSYHIFLFNETDGVLVGTGLSGNGSTVSASDYVRSTSVMTSAIEITEKKAYSIRLWVSSSCPTYGLGCASNSGYTECYTEAQFVKEG